MLPAAQKTRRVGDAPRRCVDFRVYAKSNGYIPCECFLSTGKCRFEGRPGQPCRNFPCAQKQHPFVSTRLDKLQ